jgi:hypothetical protein
LRKAPTTRSGRHNAQTRLIATAQFGGSARQSATGSRGRTAPAFSAGRQPSLAWPATRSALLHNYRSLHMSRSARFCREVIMGGDGPPCAVWQGASGAG